MRTATSSRRREYEPYGAQLTPVIQDGPGYTGHVQDAATGLAYMQQRYYDPLLGRFLSVDPVTAHANPGSNFNRYWYANNNPYKFTDPDGRVAVVTRMKDGSVQVDIPAQFKGPAATPENVSAIKGQVQGLSGTYKVDGKDTQVNFRITEVTKDTPRAARNTITLTEGPTERRNGLSAAEQGGKRAWIDVTDRFVPNGTPSHEILHLADNRDRYDTTNRKIDPAQGNNIMNVVPGVMDSSNVQEIMDSRNNIFRREGN
ncbi:RHS repeat-associated core domain-containing protein [[Pseudomonas] boreopolis]|uniref:RHS repeat-associated core domain-containing protein n=1 Tax=Xanthomonas boreopolis TaxID=86183 RepID=UPI003D9B69D2